MPYFLLTLVIAGAGTFLLINYVTGSLQDRINNQLIDAGRIVSAQMVQHEEERLQTLRTVAGTIGVAEAVATEDREALASLVPQIIANSDADAVELINMDGIEIYGWQQSADPGSEPIERSGADLSQIEDVQLVLRGVVDEFGDKRTFLSRTPDGLILFTVGPLKTETGEQVGAVLVGNDLRQLTIDLTLNAVARVTLYDRQGRVLQTTLGGSQDEFMENIHESPQLYEKITTQLETIPVAVVDPENEVPLRQVEALDQTYQLAFGDWRLRGSSFGMFSVALPRNFLQTTVINSRNLFVLIFSIAILGVFTSGVIVARRLSQPIHRLVDTATAVTAGNLDRRSGISGNDEIGRLAQAFDTMTETLAQRNRQLLEKASELEAIVDSIADGVLVMNNNEEIITMNPAARHLLSDMSHDFFLGPMRELSAAFTIGAGETEDATTETTPATTQNQKVKRFQVGNRILGAVGAPVKTPAGEKIGGVIVLRDITREAEAENLKDAFITSISHELRTPLTVIKVYTELMQSSANGSLDEKYKSFIHNINKGSEELERHINQLISISELQAGTLHLNRVEVELTQLVLSVVDQWRQRMAEKKLTLSVRQPDENLIVQADMVHLSWAIDNLMSNAYNYTPSDGEVEVRIYQTGDDAHVDVIDNGIGIAIADQPHLFDRFFRAHNTANYEARGVGLGLYITRSIVELHEGNVTVKSESGHGSTFTVTVPLAREHEPTKQ